MQSWNVLPYIIVPALGVVAGAATAMLRPIAPIVRSAIQHFAAGVAFSVVAVELLPDLTATHAIPEVIGGFLSGVVLLMLIRSKFPENETSAAEGDGTSRLTILPVGMLTGIGIDVFLDGLLLGLGISLGAKEGVLLAAALGLELYSLGLALGADMIDRGFHKNKTLIVSTGIGVLLIAGALTGFLLLSSASAHILAAVLSFGCAALLFLVTEELLVEAHEVPETAFTTGSFFAGFLLFLVLGMAL